jgi:dCTP deaminase
MARFRRRRGGRLILTGKMIASEHAAGRITIDPYYPKRISPNSYDFSLGAKLKRYSSYVLDCRIPNETVESEISQEGTVLQPGRIYLGHTAETMGSDHYVPIIRGRSSIARLGLFIHVTADIIDIGSHNQWTLQLHAVQPVRVYPGMIIGQVTFWVPKGEIDLYHGKYQGSMGPWGSKVHLDFQSTDGAEEGGVL